MTTAHITRLLKELENIATSDFKKCSIPHATAADFATWAKSRAQLAVNEVTAAIAREAEEQATQEQYISVHHAASRGYGNSEMRKNATEPWVLVKPGCVLPFDYQYRAVHKEVPKKQVTLDPAIREGVIALLQELGLTK